MIPAAGFGDTLSLWSIRVCAAIRLFDRSVYQESMEIPISAVILAFSPQESLVFTLRPHPPTLSYRL
ncbi:hypothetical protein PM082_015398 [Marasmius tenuissimus]|nr:hypothetical protein PM082_015398 [Marasmius tenuissimus]